MGDVCPVFRRCFTAGRQVVQAELQITALGVYEAELNGERIGDFVMAPGWTSYDHRLQVQTYDVTDLLETENDLRVTVGRGWFRSPMPGWIDSEDKRQRYARPCGLIALLTLRYTDGGEERIVTDEAWRVGESPVRFSEIYDGETYDARLEWNAERAWQPARLLDWTKDILIPQE
nr:alpha-L-rhamnosidase N-terminal domain-containing protein [Lachnospiraceae bacterium]